MEDQGTKERFMEDSAAITGDDAAMRREDLRRSAIIAQLNKERQPKQSEQITNLAAGFSADVPQAPTDGGDPLYAAGIRVPRRTPAATQQPETGLTPKRKKPEEETHAALFAGTALRPRARR